MKKLHNNFYWTCLVWVLPILIGCTHSVNEPEEKEPPQPCKDLCGQAFLQGYNDHRGIRVINLNTSEFTETDGKGNFELPLPPDGTYDLIAVFPMFINDTVSVKIVDSTVTKLPRMTLEQYLKTRIIPDTTVFFLNDSVRLTIEVTNLLGRVMQGPDFRVDQIWLRDTQDTTKIFVTYYALRVDPDSAPYLPLEIKFFRLVIPIAAYRLYTPPVYDPTRLSPGMYQAWPADRFGVDSGQPYILGGTFSFGNSFNPAKGRAEIEIQ